MFYDYSWWDLIPLPFFIMGMRAIYFRRVVGEKASREGSGYLALHAFTYMIIDVMRHRNGWAVLDAGVFAFWSYIWWNSGGGTSVKNFLQSLAMKPAHAVN